MILTFRSKHARLPIGGVRSIYGYIDCAGLTCASSRISFVMGSTVSWFLLRAGALAARNDTPKAGEP